LIAAKYSGVNLPVADDFVFGETNKKPDFLKKFPSGKVPALELVDGTCLNESNAIAYFVSNDQLKGKDALTKAQVLQWMNFADFEILPAASTLVYSALGAMQANKQTADRAKDDLGKALKVLNDYLLSRTFLVGERVTLADIAVCCTLLNAYRYVLEPNMRNKYGNVNRWFVTVVNQPDVKAVIGGVEMCPAGGAKPVAAPTPAAKDNKKADKKAAKAEKPKAEKKAKEPENDDMLDEPKPEKSKDPFAEMPKGTFDMDDFKRFYSNNDEVKSVPYFWEKFDPAHYSIWRCDYKYADELTMVFMSCNLIGGMFQRLEKLRKNAFASVCLFGENNNSTISGIWVWKGQGLAFELSEDWQIDYPSYDWKKLDPASEETKKLVDQYFKWEGTDLEGRKFNQGKIFK